MRLLFTAGFVASSIGAMIGVHTNNGWLVLMHAVLMVINLHADISYKEKD